MLQSPRGNRLLAQGAPAKGARRLDSLSVGNVAVTGENGFPGPATIIVLNYNGAPVIERCLQSLLAQTYPAFDVLIIDNGSRDGSVDRIRRYLGSGRLSVLALARNVGVAVGRNIGLQHARGEFVAFMDSDGYPRPTWLAEAVRTATSSPDIGAVASLVVFAKRSDVVNGAGGTLNWQGYGGDFCFNELEERAELPQEVLYPMGCGMLIRREALETVGGFDPHLFNYYDDVDLGIRLWRSGWRVVVAPEARVEHDFNYSETFLGTKAFLCERNRIRTVLKYFPLRRLPLWLAGEIQSLRYLAIPGMRTLIARAWLWNLRHLGSALGLRAKFAGRSERFWTRLHYSRGFYPPPVPNNQALIPEPERFCRRVVLDGVRDRGRLSFGWYFPESAGARRYRWMAREAGLFLHSGQPARFFTLAACGYGRASRLEITLRELSSRQALAHLELRLNRHWTRRTWQLDLPSGTYEVLLSAQERIGPDRRQLGAAVRAAGIF